MKGLIIAAGYGTRFLPVTKTIPKEMLPLITKPSISFIIEEFVSSGIKDIVIISSRRKKSLEDFLDREIELETIFERESSKEKQNKIKPFDANFIFIRQTEMKGTGHALMMAEPAIGDEPFVTAYPDDLHFGDRPLAKQLIDEYDKTGCSVLASLNNPPNLNRYGILELASDNLHVKNIVEKPAAGTEPSREASIGRYLYTPELFKYLKEGWKKHTSGEYFHVYALKKLMDQNKVVYKTIEGERLDTGEPAGYLRAIIKYAMQDKEYKKVIEEELQK